MTRIGIVQHPSTDQLNENMKHIQKHAQEANLAGCTCVCFPECNLTGYFPERAHELALNIDAEVFSCILHLAIELELDILVGFMERSEHFYITHGIFRADGTTDFYRKTHLGKKEELFFSAGNNLNVYTLSDGLCIGLQICVENHFPDITQILSLRGAEVIFAPHAVPLVSGNRQQIWNKFIPARSYDNRVYMACCNQWDAQRFGGGCLVTNPRGEIAVEHYGSGSALITADIDRTLLASFRQAEGKASTHYYPKRKKTELYD